MNSFELHGLIKNGENDYIEFKLQEVKAKELSEEIIAFANAEGGIILLGVSDDGLVHGVNEINAEETIMNICRNNCIPHIIPKVEKVYVEDKLLYLIHISKGLNKPYYTTDNKYYIRVGSTKRIASKEELMRLFEASGSIHFDVSPVFDTSINEIDFKSVRDYFMTYNTFDLYEESQESVLSILTNADILRDIDGRKVCTIGGLLIFGKNIDRYLPQNGVSFAHFKGNDITETLIDKKVITGTLPNIADQLMTIYKNNMLNSSEIKDFKREETTDYPLTVLREATVNALVHRNYSITGSKIRIFMFDDRIEFHSPGRLPNTVSIAKMKIGVSYARNPFLVKYLENLRYIDQLGRGIPMILKSMKDNNKKEPNLIESGEEFILTIYKN